MLVEHRDRPRNTHNDQRLAGQEGKDDGAQDRRQQDLVDAVLHVCLGEHVEREGEGGKNTAVVVSSSLKSKQS